MFGCLDYGEPVTIHAIVLDTPASRHSRGFLKKLVLLCATLVFVFQARTSQLAVIVLSPSTLAPGRLPPDWQVKVNHGKPDVTVCNDVEGPCVHLRSVKASFSLERSVDVDPAATPYLAWNWKVTQLPPAGDFRKSATDDQGSSAGRVFGPQGSNLHLGQQRAQRHGA